jgi:hypothetical protein
MCGCVYVDVFVVCVLVFDYYYYYYYYYHLTAIGLTPGGSSTHLHTNSTQNTEDGTCITMKKNYLKKKQLQRKNWEVNCEVRAVPRLWKLYSGILLTNVVKARKNLN